MLQKLQTEIGEWAQRNFGDNRDPFLGVVEEVGELAHAILKRKQDIRGAQDAAIIDAVGDIVIYLADFCEREGICLQTCTELTWGEVKKRDWKQFPKNGTTE